MSLKKNEKIQLKIDSISSDGNGVGRHEGQVVFVPNTAVGDLAEILIVKPAKTHAFGRMERLITPGAGRVQSDCPVSVQCGGCCFRHLSYEAELEAKQGFVRDALARIAGLEVPVETILPSPQVHRYRNKAQYPLASGPDGSIIHGFYADRSHRVAPCRDCLLHPKKVNEIVEKTAEWLAAAKITPYDEQQHKGLVRHICLRQSSESGEILLSLVVNGAGLPGQDALAAELKTFFPEIVGVLINPNKKRTNVIFGPIFSTVSGEAFIRDKLCGVPQKLGPASFSQVNHNGAELLFSVARDFAVLHPNETLLDLYCGTGVIGLSMADGCREVVGVEIVPEAVKSARQSAEEMGLSNARFLCADASEAARQLAEENLRPDVVLLDPPRKGCGEDTLRPVLQMAPQRVVMVSCNPATMARDVAFLAASGYDLCKVQPVDMFPRTKHVETVVLLSKHTLY